MSSEITSDDLMLIQRFREEFKCAPIIGVFAPGRVNLIGEHVDYNEGFVLPFCLPFRTSIVGGLTPSDEGGVTTIVSCNIRGESSRVSFTVDSSLCRGSPSWANYVKGTIAQYLADLPRGCAFQCVIQSDVPIGSGLSSSASLEVAMATFLEVLFSIDTKDKLKSGVVKALRCQKAEHTFAGVPCGLMDQYISAMGQKDNLLLLDCRSNTFELIEMGTPAEGGGKPVVVVCNSHVKHSLSGSEYPDRVRQCKEALLAVQRLHPDIRSLRDATLEILEEANSSRYVSAVPKEFLGNISVTQHSYGNQNQNMSSETLSRAAYMRAYHCITENLRTLSAVDGIRSGDYRKVGKAMTASHRSLQYDYEVSCPEIDLLVDAALKVDGVYGSRITGGGFGGCTVTLVQPGAVEALVKALKDANSLSECYIVQPSSGCGQLDIAAAISGPVTSRYGDDDEDSGIYVPEIGNLASSTTYWSSFAEDSFIQFKESPWLTATALFAFAALASFVASRRK